MRTLLATAIVIVLLMGGCAKGEPITTKPAPAPTDTSVPPTPPPTPASEDREKCPERLLDPDEQSGTLGAPGAAPRRPTIETPDAAWICSYGAKDDGANAGGATAYTWTRFGDVHPVGSSELNDLVTSLGGLVPVPNDRACLSNLGPRWLLVLERDGQRSGVTIDDFGCGDVLMTDDPFETAPGEAQQKGTVPGALNAPPSLLRQVKTIGSA